jgi:putative membrane protein
MLPLAHTSAIYAMAELVPVTIAILLYWQRAMTLSWKGRPVPAWRQACFGTGLALIVLVGFSPVGQLSDELVYMHMIEHLVIGDLGPLLLVLGLTGPMLQPLLAIRGLGWMRNLASPIVALPLWAISLYTWHIPVLYQGAFGGAPVHVLEHGSFVIFGCLMWMPLLGPLPKPDWFGHFWQLGYVVGVRFTSAVLGNVLMWSATVLYPIYASGEAEQRISPLADQSAAGAIMMAEGRW